MTPAPWDRPPAARAVVLLAIAAACASDAPTASGRNDSLIRFTVTNQLAAPVTINVDDTLALILLGGTSGGVAAQPTAQWLTWTSAKPTDTTGTPIPDDIGEVRIPMSGIRPTLEITNVIDDITYVTPELFNPTSERVSIGVYEGSTLWCVSVLLAASSGVPGFTRIGYYRLLAATEIRAYRGPLCTGPYVAWPSSQLAKFTPKSGVVSLTLALAP
jgi:hypothetical protein